MKRFFLIITSVVFQGGFGAERENALSFRELVERDWDSQEARKGRTSVASEAIRDALERAGRLLLDLKGMEEGPDLDSEEALLEELRNRMGGLESMEAAERLSFYREVRWLARGAALKNPLLGSGKMVFLKRHRFICQMLHEYLGYFYDYGDIDGGGVFLLEQPGGSVKTGQIIITDLIQGRLPRGNYTTLALSFDGRTIYFAFAERAPEKPDYYSPDRRCFHIYAMDADGGNLRQLTSGPNDHFDPCPLPDGGLAFLSTGRGGFGRCHNPWEPLPAYTLHRMDSDGRNVRTLSFHETNEWHPSVLSDGCIVYSRWDYVDRSAANYHGLWISNPDGSGARVLFGNYTQKINACFQPRAIPNSTRVVFVAGAHHADVGGSLVAVDPNRIRLDGKTGQDGFDSLEVLTPEVCFPEAPGWPDSYFHSPWPLSETYSLVAFSFDPLPGMGPGVKKDSECGIYLFDRFGDLELLHREKGISSMYPIPLRERPVPPVVPSTIDPQLGDEGELILADVNRSLLPLPAGRPVRALRIFQVLPKSETHVANRPRLGYANAESARMFLGTVPVEADGSAYFRVPARKPLYFQAVDGAGWAVQGMRSVAYLQPGERRSCVGCHEPTGTAPNNRQILAVQREPSRIRPGPDGSRPWSFQRLVQPVLDARCLRCHNGKEKEVPCNLAGSPAGEFTISYNSLRPHVRWHEWGGASIDEVATRPGRMPSDVSRLTTILDDAHHRNEVQLTDSERRRIYLWLDGNASFFGSYSKEERLAQMKGEVIPPPKLQ